MQENEWYWYFSVQSYSLFRFTEYRLLSPLYWFSFVIPPTSSHCFTKSKQSREESPQRIETQIKEDPLCNFESLRFNGFRLHFFVCQGKNQGRHGWICRYKLDQLKRNNRREDNKWTINICQNLVGETGYLRVVFSWGFISIYRDNNRTCSNYCCFRKTVYYRTNTEKCRKEFVFAHIFNRNCECLGFF